MSAWDDLGVEKQEKLMTIFIEIVDDFLEESSEGIKMSLNNKHELHEMVENIWDMYLGDLNQFRR